MSDRFDFIAIGPHGVYALCEDLPHDPKFGAAFVARIKARGHRVERVPVAEAVERHRAFLDLAERSPTFLALLAAE